MSGTSPTAEALLAELVARVEQQDEKIRRLDATLKALARLPDEPPTTVLIDTKRATSAPTVPLQARSSAGLLRAALDLTDEAMVGVDAGGAVRVWNAAAARLFGWPAGEVLGSPPPFVPDDKSDEHAEMLRGDLADAVTVRRRKDGDLMSVRVTATPAKGGGVVFAFRSADTAADEGPAEPPGPAADRSVQRFATLGRALAGVAHDFNNLLSVIRGHADLLVERAAPGSAVPEGAQAGAATAELAADVTRRLLSVARPEPGTPHRADVNGLVTGLSRVLRAVVGARVTVAVTTADGLGPAEVHPADLTQVLLNLAVNARDAMPDGGTLTIRTAPAAGESVVLTVADTGVGMDAATKARMFDPFFTTRDGGTGLGLATVREVVTRAGGHIEVESEPGWGTQVRVYLRTV